MKLHKILCEAVATTLAKIFLDNQQADQAVSVLLKSNPSWGARDRHFLADSIYEVVRHYRFYSFCANLEQPKNSKDFAKLLAVKLVLNEIPLPDWELFEGINSKEILAKSEAKIDRAIKYSIPDWLDEKGFAQFKETWEEELKALQTPAKLCIRGNTLKVNAKKIEDFFTSENIQFSKNETVLFGYEITGRRDLTKTKPFLDGWFEVQDINSQFVSEQIQLTPQSSVVDACAGAGGKSLHVATRMLNKGQVVAMDIFESKLKELQKRAKRNHLNNIITELASDYAHEKYAGWADVVIIDAPCSGLGVLKRNPDSKWKMNPTKINEIKHVQASLLNDCSKMLKPGGALLYITCTLFEDENESQINSFLATHPSYSLRLKKTLLPSETGFDGFYFCILDKK